MNRNSTIPCSFKLAYESLTKTYDINRNISRDAFITMFREFIRRDFHLLVCYIVDADYPVENTGYHGNLEDSPPITINSLYDKISRTTHNNGLAFYVKPIDFTYSNDLAIELGVPTEDDMNPMHECLLCHTETYTAAYYGCTHMLCNDCIVGCNRSHITRCPFCRNSPISSL